MNKNTITGFTLSEVLIALGIIGVIAAITIPALNNTVQDMQYKTAYKKAYSVMTQALTRANGDNLMSPRTTWCGAPEAPSNWNAFKSYFKIVKECSDSDYNDNCWALGEQAHASAYPPGVPGPSADGSGISFFVDASGMAWMYHPCFYYLLDTNGLKGPNKYGRDRFYFTFAPDIASPQSNGVLNKIWTQGDIIDPDPNWCKSGKCYNQSWLIN